MLDLYSPEGIDFLSADDSRVIGKVAFTEIAVFTNGPLSISHEDKKLMVCISSLSQAVNEFLSKYLYEFYFYKPILSISPLRPKVDRWDIKVSAKICCIEREGMKKMHE